MKPMWHAFAVACLAGLVAEITVQGSALQLTAYGWLPLAVAVTTFVITFSFIRTFKRL